MNTAQTIQSTPLERISRGDYFVSSFIDTVPSGSFKKWAILVGAKDIHFGFEVITSNRCFITFYINSTTSASTSSQPFNNSNHASANTTDTEMVTGLSGGDGTVWLRSASYPGGVGLSGNDIGARSEELILAANSKHVLRVSNDEASIMNYSLRAAFYDSQ
ncbi:MAG: hypothetical protein ABW166_21730 [Sedimenticola sp.]